MISQPVRTDVEALFFLSLLKRECNIGPDWSPLRAHLDGVGCFRTELDAAFAQRRWDESQAILGDFWRVATSAI